MRVSYAAGVEDQNTFVLGDNEKFIASLPEKMAARVRELFTRVGRAARTLADDHDPLPPLPDDPDALSFGIAALIDMEAPRRQELLVSRLASERLTIVEQLLASAVGSLEARAKVHGRAKTNGRGHHVST